MAIKIGDLIEIEWDDHCTLAPNGWDDIKKAYTPVVCKTVGYVIGLNKKTVTLTATRDTESKMVSGYMTRLRSAIKRTNVLKGLR